jgi:hypothetical protein
MRKSEDNEKRVGLDANSRGGGRIMTDIHFEMRAWRKHLRESRLKKKKKKKCESCKCEPEVKDNE